MVCARGAVWCGAPRLTRTAQQERTSSGTKRVRNSCWSYDVVLFHEGLLPAAGLPFVFEGGVAMVDVVTALKTAMQERGVDAEDVGLRLITRSHSNTYKSAFPEQDDDGSMEEWVRAQVMRDREEVDWRTVAQKMLVAKSGLMESVEGLIAPGLAGAQSHNSLHNTSASIDAVFERAARHEAERVFWATFNPYDYDRTPIEIAAVLDDEL